MRDNNISISVISPVYRAQGGVDALVTRIKAVLDNLGRQYEIILVEDGSPDKSWDEIASIASGDNRVKGVKLSRNFGQHNAISAGLKQARGEWVVVMDCDLQDRPEEIPALLQKAEEGHDIVLARRKRRKDGALKKFYSKLFYSVLGYLTGTKQDPSVANFGIYNRKVVDVINNMKQTNRYFPLLVQWAGFESTAIDVEHAQREVGKTTYSFNKALRLAMDVILAYSDRPLRLTIKLGSGDLFDILRDGFGSDDQCDQK